jgi:hypothetical protein
MNLTKKLVGLLPLAALALSATACGGYTRTPEQWTEDTRQMLEAQSEFIKTCYNRELKQNPKLEGNVSVKFLVENGSGRVKRVKIDDAGTTAGDPVRKCVMENIKDLRIKPPDANDGRATFTWEFKATIPSADEPAADAAAPPAS